MSGTHRSLLQTGGRNEARFSSTQFLTLTGLSMASGEPCSRTGAVLGPSEWLGSAQSPIGRLVISIQRAGQHRGRLATAPRPVSECPGAAAAAPASPQALPHVGGRPADQQARGGGGGGGRGQPEAAVRQYREHS